MMARPRCDARSVGGVLRLKEEAHSSEKSRGKRRVFHPLRPASPQAVSAVLSSFQILSVILRCAIENAC